MTKIKGVKIKTDDRPIIRLATARHVDRDPTWRELDAGDLYIDLVDLVEGWGTLDRKDAVPLLAEIADRLATLEEMKRKLRGLE